MSTSPAWLTATAHQKLQQEYKHLTTEGRIRIADRLAEAGMIHAHGDRSQRRYVNPMVTLAWDRALAPELPGW